MGEIVGGVAMSHGPQLLTPPDKWSELPNRTKGPFHPKLGIADEITPEAMRANAERCHAAIAVLRDKIATWKPDTILIVGDDQEENILKDNMSAFTIYVGGEADASLKYRYFGQKEEDQVTHYSVNSTLSKEILHGLMDAGFDPSWSEKLRYPTGLGHAFGRALDFLIPEANVAIVPIMVNTYYPPAPNAQRVLKFGKAVGDILAKTNAAGRMVIVGSGGLSHTKINEALDHEVINAIEANDTAYLGSMPSEIFVSGTSEILNWIIVAAATGAKAKMVDYVPCYRNELGVGCAMGFALWN